ncbi:MAG TPA: amidohydrolase family protein [Gemmatimonadaceae bacterium]|nr:amidohydrolase family protein [Gemmatimonadaceae bacterium]
MSRRTHRIAMIAVVAIGLPARDVPRAPRATHAIVLLGGRVMDPESGLDAVRNVAIDGGRVTEITMAPLVGRDTIDAHGLVVAPGFIDLHQHAQDSAGYAVEARDGTTTALELEEGPADVPPWYAARAGHALINYGAGVGHVAVRMAVMHDTGVEAPVGPARDSAATPAQIAEIRRRIEQGLDDGAVGVGFILAWTRAARPWEVLEVFRAAAAHHASVHIHMRDVDDPEYFLDIEEAIAAAAATGAPLHVVHIASSALEDTPKYLDVIRGARQRGLDVTTECYPYDASMTTIESANPNWRDEPDSWFSRIEWPVTGERLTRESFPRFLAMGGNFVIHNNTEAMVRAAVADSLTMIASDGILDNGVGHPRVAGTFARVLGRYVRDEHALTLMMALRKMTLMPARRLEARVPAMRRKGRVRIGDDADLVLFDPTTVADRATYREPTLPPIGMPFVLVNGTVVVRNGRVVAGVAPGQAVRAPIRAGPGR